jgi:hypothetical protein
MESQFNDRDFENLLSDHADQYRMYPSEKVWKGIHDALHIRHKWYGISAFAILLLASTILYLFILKNHTDKPVIAEVIKSLPAEKAQTQSLKSFTEKDGLLTSKIIKQDNSSPETVQRTKAIPEKIIAALHNPVSVQSAENTTDNLQPEKINDKTEIADNRTMEKQTVPAQTATSALEKEHDNSLDETIGKKMIADAKIREAIHALASVNAPIIISKKQSGFSTRIYFTPTISYRKLTENKRYYPAVPFAYSQVIDINNVVNQKPLMGLEFGIEEKYRINDLVSVKSGFQFNINRYNISAYSRPTEIATVAINNGFRTYSLTSLSNYGNFTGTSQTWLENFYFQAALPIGAEITLAARKNFSWGISGTIQPTYVIGDRAYLISSDYKNYAKFPDLMRRWNLSTGLETFVSYSTGKINWQAGPHVRYQHLSSFVSGYPVKENLFAIGLKVGATFNKKK